MYLGGRLLSSDLSTITRHAFFFSQVTEPVQQNPKLVLSCSPAPAILRGDSIACTARAEPAGAPRTEMVWSFVDSAGHTIAGPTGTDTVWGGTMVVPGLLKVSGKVSGTPSMDSATITVTDRTWPALTMQARENGHGDLPPAASVSADSEMAHTHVDLPTSAPVREIHSGPNSGWAFIDSVRTVGVTTHLNDAWQPGSVWYQLQHYGFWQNDPNGNPLYYCTQAQIPTLLIAARKHEGAGLSMHNSHVDVFKRWVNNHTPQRDIERATVYIPSLTGVFSILDWYRQLYAARILAPMMGDPNQHHTNVTSAPGLVPPAQFPCKPRY